MKGIIENVPEVDVLLNSSTEFHFTLPSFSQIVSKKYTLGGFSIVSDDKVKESDLIYGRLPQNANEIVVEKWVLENALEDSTLSNFMVLTSFLNKELTPKNRKYSFIIVGIANTGENTVYMNKWSMMDFAPSDLRRSGIKVISVSEFAKYNNINLNIKKNECVLNIETSDLYHIDDVVLGEDERLTYDILSRIDFKDCPFDVVVNDECYTEILISVASDNHEKLQFYCDNEYEKNKIENYIESVKDYYQSGELRATLENGFDKPADIKEVELLLEFKSEYFDILNPYIEESKQNVTARVLITVTILLISAVIIFFSMKSYSIKNIYDIGVYRAIGINKRSIVFVYAFQIFIVSLRTTLVGSFVCFALTQIIASVPLIDAGSIAVSFETFVYTTLGLLLFNVIVGVIPVLMYLRLTPSKLLTKTDV